MKLFSEHLEETISYEPLNEAQKEYNMRAKYDMFNQKYFDGICPSDIPLKWSRTKKMGGAVRSLYWTTGKGRYKKITKWEFQELILSTFYLRTEEQIDSILLHEMIHIWLMMNELHEGYNIKLHGPEFKAKMHEVSQKSGITVSLYDTPEQRGEMVHNTTGREFGVVMVWDNGKPDSIAVFTPKAVRDDTERLESIMKRNLKNGQEVLIGTSKHPAIEQFPIKRTMSSFSLYVLKDELADGIMSDGWSELKHIIHNPSETAPEPSKEQLTNKLWSLSMKLSSIRQPSKKQEAIAEINKLRSQLGMELMPTS